MKVLLELSKTFQRWFVYDRRISQSWNHYAASERAETTKGNPVKRVQWQVFCIMVTSGGALILLLCVDQFQNRYPKKKICDLKFPNANFTIGPNVSDTHSIEVYLVSQLGFWECWKVQRYYHHGGAYLLQPSMKIVKGLVEGKKMEQSRRDHRPGHRTTQGPQGQAWPSHSSHSVVRYSTPRATPWNTQGEQCRPTCHPKWQTSSET